MRKLMLIAAMAGALMAAQGGSQQLSPNQVVAVVDGKKVTVADVNRYLEAVTGNPNFTLNQVPAPQRLGVVQDYVTKQILYQYAKKVENTPTYKVLAKNLAVSIWAKQEAQKIKVSEKEIEEFYNKNKDKFKTKDGKYLPLSQVKAFIRQLLKSQKALQYIRSIINKHHIKYEIN